MIRQKNSGFQLSLQRKEKIEKKFKKLKKIQKIEKKHAMKSVPVGGVPIRFPDELDPFPAQLALMSKVIASLKRSQNALLGSPTGTGKTLVRFATTRTL